MPPVQGSPTAPLLPVAYRQIVEEIDVMLQHALAQGLSVGADIPASFESLRRTLDTRPDGAEVPSSLGQLTRIHSDLSRLVAPALPGSLVFLKQERENAGHLHFLGSVGLVRRLMSVALLSIVALFALSLSQEVNGSPSNFSLLKNSGYSLLLNELFLLAAASLGVSFANLYQAQIYLRNRTFDPTLEPSYWVRYVLGIMSGTILAFLVPVEHLLEGSNEATMHGMAKPTLALLGGFSTQALYRILFQMVGAVESVVRGNGQDALEVERARVQLEGERQEQQRRQTLTTRVRTLQSRTQDPQAKAALGGLLDELIGVDTSPFRESTPGSELEESAETSTASEPRPEASRSAPPEP